MPAPKGHPNLTRAGQGAPPKTDKVRITTTVLSVTKIHLKSMGAMGDAIDRLCREWDEQKRYIQQLEAQISQLEKRIKAREALRWDEN